MNYEEVKRNAKMDENSCYCLSVKQLKTLGVTDDVLYKLIENKDRIITAYGLDDLYLADVLTNRKEALYDLQDLVQEDSEYALETANASELHLPEGNMCEEFRDAVSEDALAIGVISDLDNLLTKYNEILLS
ncbi:MAG: hypothetical protein ACRCX2_01420 [Paraclostridium sp.]